MEYAEGHVVYFARQDPLRAVVVPILALEAILTVGLLACWELVLRRRLQLVPAFHLFFLAICAAPVGIASLGLLRAAPFDLTALVRGRWFWLAAFLLGAVPLAWACVRPIRASRLMRSLLLYSWPVLILVLVQAVRGSLLFPHGAYADGALAAPLRSPQGRPRVVWIIFDELSQAIAFGNRQADLALPNLDALKAQSFYATAAESPAGWTDLSMPSLILGEKVVQAWPDGPGDLHVKLSSRPEPVSWGSLPNVFDDARDLALNTALVGWFHPYGRLLNRSLTKCYWNGGWMVPGTQDPSRPQPLADGMWDRVRLQSAAMPLIGHLPGMFAGMYARQEKIAGVEYLTARGREVGSDPKIGLVLIHLPVPHPPAVYDRARGKFAPRGRISYLDDVALVDREMGLLRRAMEEAGLWDESAVLVSADHGWRTALWRGSPEWTAEDESASRQDTSGIPFLLKLAGQTSGCVYNKRFNTVVTRRLITSILKGQVTDPAAVATLIEGSALR